MFKTLIVTMFTILCLSCGTAPNEAPPTEAVTATESAVALNGSMTMTGQYACGGETFNIKQVITQSGPGNSNFYTTNVGSTLPTGFNWSDHTQVALVCPTQYIETSTCGSSGEHCGVFRVHCSMFSKIRNFPSWTLSGSVETGILLFPSYTAHGLYQMDLWYEGGGNGIGISNCSSGFGANLYYVFSG